MMTYAPSCTAPPTDARLDAAIADLGPIVAALHARNPDVDAVLEVLDGRYLGAYRSAADWALDYIGSGSTPAPEPGDFDAATFADDAIASGDIVVIVLADGIHVFDGDFR